jgi:hypothetical protein
MIPLIRDGNSNCAQAVLRLPTSAFSDANVDYDRAETHTPPRCPNIGADTLILASAEAISTAPGRIACFCLRTAFLVAQFAPIR